MNPEILATLEQAKTSLEYGLSKNSEAHMAAVLAWLTLAIQLVKEEEPD